MKTALQVVGGGGVLLFLATVFTSFPNLVIHWMTTVGPLEEAAAIVVLGGGPVRKDGVLSESSLRRALRGMRLYRDGLAPLLVFAGPVSSSGYVEAEVRASLARECGIPGAAILTESASRTTREEAVNMARLLQPRGIRRILLVTDVESMRRARGTFQKHGFEALAAPVAEVAVIADGPEDRLDLMRRVAIELIAGLYYAIAGYV